MSLSLALSTIRNYHNLTQKRLSIELGTSTSMVSMIESGDKLPSTNLLDRYSRYFNIPVASIYILGYQLDSGNLQTEHQLDANTIFIIQHLQNKKRSSKNDR